MDCSRLNLSHRNLGIITPTLIEGYGDVKVLDVSNNSLTSVDFLRHFSCLNSVILDHNEIPSSVIFPLMPSVKVLWMNFNHLTHLVPFIKYLHASFPNLKHLSLMGNEIVPPCREETYYEYLQYRLFVISCFENLTYLDDREVIDDEKEEAARLYKHHPQEEQRQSSRISDVFYSAIDRIRHLLYPGPVTGQRFEQNIQRSSVI